MEALQMLKFFLRKEELNFSRGIITPQSDLLCDDPDEKVHNPLLSRQQEIDQMLQEVLRDEEVDHISDSVELFGLGR